MLDDVEPMPGVVAGWRRTKAGTWEARVSYALGDETGEWSPAGCSPPC